MTTSSLSHRDIRHPTSHPRTEVPLAPSLLQSQVTHGRTSPPKEARKGRSSRPSATSTQTQTVAGKDQGRSSHGVTSPPPPLANLSASRRPPGHFLHTRQPAARPGYLRYMPFSTYSIHRTNQTPNRGHLEPPSPSKPRDTFRNNETPYSHQLHTSDQFSRPLSLPARCQLVVCCPLFSRIRIGLSGAADFCTPPSTIPLFSSPPNSLGFPACFPVTGFTSVIALLLSGASSYLLLLITSPPG